MPRVLRRGISERHSDNATDGMMNRIVIKFNPLLKAGIQ